MEKSINQILFVNRTPSEVWEYLTRPELMELWLMKNDFQPVLGHEFQFRHNPLPNFNFSGIVYCKVLEIVPLKKLSYSWKGGGTDGTITLDSVVVWTLVEKDNGTELQLVHTGFTDQLHPMVYSIMNDGWRQNTQKIPVLINNAKHDTTEA